MTRCLRSALLCFVVFASSALVAQSPEGGIAGTIADASGARLNGAKITASATDFTLTRGTESGGSGEFRIAPLPPGHYEIKVEAPNFAPALVQVTVTVGSTPTVNVNLKPGAVR